MKKLTDDEITKLVEALEFYADPLTYFAIAFIPDPPCGALMEDFSEATDYLGNVRVKPGKLAREVLDELFPEGEE